MTCYQRWVFGYGPDRDWAPAPAPTEPPRPASAVAPERLRPWVKQAPRLSSQICISLARLSETIGEHAVRISCRQYTLLNEPCVMVHVGRGKIAPKPEVRYLVSSRQVRDAAGGQDLFVLRRYRVHDDGGLGVGISVLDEGSNPPRDGVDTVDTGISKRCGCHSNAPTQGIHHIPHLVALRPGRFAILVALDDGDDDVDATLWPPVGDNGATESSLEVNAEVTLARVAKVTAPLFGCERRVLDVGRQDDVRREGRRSRKRPWPVNGAAEFEPRNSRLRRSLNLQISRSRGRGSHTSFEI